MSRIIITSILIGTILWAAVYLSIRDVIRNDSNNENQKYKSIYTGMFLPAVLIAAVGLDLILYGPQSSITNLIFYSVNLLVIFTIYYIFLLIFLKSFRKHFHPLIVSTLWMLPNILFFYLTSRVTLTVDNPYIIEVSKYIIMIIVGIWLFGFIAIILYKIYEHHSYRKFILEDAVEIKDEYILSLFENEYKKIEHLKIDLKLMKSRQIRTPLTIGVHNKVVVLPNINYTDEEYELIFKHEIIHIARNDVATKIYFVFCNALCWFNPFMWLANKKCSEDLELSCDYSVLSNVNEFTRKKYASLVLKTASSEKGFTTCLSVNAKSLQYRLQNIIRPKYKMKGGFLIFALIVLLIASWGNFGIAIKGYNGNEELFDSKDVIITDVYPLDDYYHTKYYSIKNEDKIIEYLSNLELSKLPTSAAIGDKDNAIGIEFKQGSKEFEIALYDHSVKLNKYNDSNDEYYYVKDGINWEYINNYIDEFPPLTLNLLQNGIDLGIKEVAILKKVESHNEIVYGLNTYQPFFGSNYYPSHIVLEFKDEVISDIEVIEDREDGIHTYTISKDCEYIIETHKQDVKYEVKASYEINNEIYEITYIFDFDYIEGTSFDEIILDKK